MLKILILLFTFLSVPAFAQTYGTLADIRNKTAVYVVSEGTEERQRISDLLTKAKKKLVTNPTDADFFVEYKLLSQQSAGFASFARGELTVYVLHDQKKSVVWSDTATGGAYRADTARKLTKKFLSALKKTS